MHVFRGESLPRYESKKPSKGSRPKKYYRIQKVETRIEMTEEKQSSHIPGLSFTEDITLCLLKPENSHVKSTDISRLNLWSFQVIP